MLDNLTSRERVIAMLAACLLPVALIYSGYSWVNSTIRERNQTINQLNGKISIETTKRIVGLRAAGRRDQYRKASLPNKIDVGFNQYKDWLFDLAAKTGLANPQLNGGQSSRKMVENKIVYETRNLTFNVDGTLKQVVNFLYQFDQKRLMHQIKSFSLIPAETTRPIDRTEGQELRVSFNIDALGMPDATLETGLPEGDWSRLSEQLEAYQYSVVHRNIFGTPNNAPTISALPPKVEPGQAIDFAIQADDSDKGDKLNFELVTSSSKGVELVQKEEGSGVLRFKSPPFDKEGSYGYEVKVSDNGCPPRSASKKFTIVVQKAKPVVVIKEEPIEQALTTRVTGFTQNVNNVWEIRLYFEAENRPQTIRKGESFELDGKQWLVKSIADDLKSCVIECEGKLMTFKLTNLLSNPVSVTEKTTGTDAESPKK